MKPEDVRKNVFGIKDQLEISRRDRQLELNELRKQMGAVVEKYNQRDRELMSVLQDVRLECQHVDESGRSALTNSRGMGQFCSICELDDY